MTKIRSFLAVSLLGVLLSTSSIAATVSEDINTAISQGNFASVEVLVAYNPSANDEALQALLQYVKNNLAESPLKAVQAAEAMDVAVRLGPNVTPANAKPVADLVKEITDQALIGCTSTASKTTDNPNKSKNSKALNAIQTAAESMAQLPVLVAANPQLLAQVKGENAQCQNDDAAQLFQTPAYVRPVIPNLGGGGNLNPPPTGNLPSAE